MFRKLSRKLKKKVKSESGQAIVEFALVLPLLLILLMGVLDFGWIFVNQYKVEKAASTAARYGAINESRYSSNKNDYLESLSRRVADNVSDGDTRSIRCFDLTGGGLPGSAAESDTIVCVKVNANNVSVTVTYPVRTLTFVASTFFGRYYPATSTSVSSY